MTAEAPAPADRPQNARVLVSAASLHRATAEIAQAIGHVLSQHGSATTVMAPGDVDAIDDYDAVVIGSAVYVGHWLDPAKDFVDRFRTDLAAPCRPHGTARSDARPGAPDVRGQA